VPLDDFISEICKPNQGWTSLMQIGADGYTASVHREDAVGSGAFIAFSDEAGNPIPIEHGGVRVVFPNLYGWKSAKFLSEIRFESVSVKGFWEKLGCHSRGRWAHGERWAPHASGIWNILAYITDRYRVVFGYGTWVAVMTQGGRALGCLVAMVGFATTPFPLFLDLETGRAACFCYSCRMSSPCVSGACVVFHHTYCDGSHWL
jgi:hypothetical protein